MRTIRRYIKRICHSCNGIGKQSSYYPNYELPGTNASCKICGGSGIETIIEEEIISDYNKYSIPKTTI